MSKEAENKIAFEALEKKLDTLVDSINKLTRQINQTPKISDKPFMTIDEMAKLAGLSRKTLEYDIEKGRLDTVQRGKSKKITQKDAAEYLNQ